jgi:P22 coat protein - gene protein 5
VSNNVLFTPNVRAKLVLFDLGNSLKVAKNMSTAITSEFTKKDYKIGDKVQVQKPYRFVASSGIGWDPQPIQDQLCTINVRQVSKIHYLMDSVEKTIEVREAQRLYTRPTATALASDINAKSATFAANNALNSVGTPGTAPTTEATYLAAGDALIQLGLPDDEELTLIMNRKMSSAFVSGTKTLFNPAGTIGGQWAKGHALDSLGYKIVRDETINKRTNGTFSGSIVVNGANQTATGGNNATMSLTISGITGTLQPGDRFVLGNASSATVGGVESIHPQTRKTTGSQQVFTVQQTTAANPTTVVVAPAITPFVDGGDAAMNQYANVNSSAVDQAILTMVGTTGLTGITQGLLLHENAFAFVSVPMWNPEGGVISANVVTDPETGLSISQVNYFDGDNRQSKWRFDCLWDNGNLYKEMACVIQS